MGLIDFGQSKEIPRPLRQKLCAFYLAVSSENNVQIMHAFQDLGVELDIRGNDSKERVTELISYLANSMLDTAPLPPDIETNPFSGENFFKQVRVKKFNPELFMVLRAMGLLRSLAETLGINSQDCWMSSIFKPYALRGIRDTEPSEQLKQDRSVAIRAALRNSVSSPFRDPLEDEAAGYCSMN